jgi:hypothetical protein
MACLPCPAGEWLVVPLKEVDKPNLCIVCPLCYVVDVLLYRIIVISIHAVSWPSRYYNMILLGKIFTKLTQVFNDVYNRSILIMKC